jgi:hypothetical protein
MTDKPDGKCWPWCAIVLGMFLAYMCSFYLTYRSRVNSYGLGVVDFPDQVAHPFFTPARLLDEHVFGLKPQVRRAVDRLGIH